MEAIFLKYEVESPRSLLFGKYEDWYNLKSKKGIWRKTGICYFNKKLEMETGGMKVLVYLTAVFVHLLVLQSRTF